MLADPSNRELAAAFGVVVDVDDEVFDLAVVGAGPAGLGRRGVRRLGGAAHAGARGRGVRRPGRHELDDPQLPRLPARHHRPAARAAGRPPGRGGSAPRSTWPAPSTGARTRGAAPPARWPTARWPRARAVILACGVTYRRLGVPSLEALVGAGVFYGAATSQARALQGAHVVVVGAGNSGGQAALHLARYAARVTIVARGRRWPRRCRTTSCGRSRPTTGSTVRTGTEVVDGGGDGRLEWVELADRGTGRAGAHRGRRAVRAHRHRDPHRLAAAGDPARRPRLRAHRRVDIDPAGGRSTGPPFALETSVPGVFAAGDVRANGVKRVAAAVGEGRGERARWSTATSSSCAPSDSSTPTRVST